MTAPGHEPRLFYEPAAGDGVADRDAGTRPAAGSDGPADATVRPSPATAVPQAERLQDDAVAWDEFVAGTPLAPYLQATPWAVVKSRNGWTAERIVTDGPGGPVGGQILTRRLGRTPWSVGYTPRGPLAGRLDAECVLAWTQAARVFATRRGLTHVIADPEIEAGGPEAAWFAAAGWRPTASPQPARTRWIDLTRAEPDLWADLRAKWRQYVQKARRSGLAVVERDAGALDDFQSIYVETARRAGFAYRTAESYRAVYEAYAARGAARLLFAVDAAGVPQATLMLVGWGRRVVEPYGGMTEAGAESHANYLLKWEAIRTSRERGFALYDLWGLSHPGIEHFKAGFGGREVRYVGGLALPVRPWLYRAFESARTVRVALARRRLQRSVEAAS